MDTCDTDRQPLGTTLVRIAMGVGAVVVGAYTVWLAVAFVAILRQQQGMGGGGWPLPGLFLVTTIAVAAVGCLALALLAAGRQRAGGRMVWMSAGGLIGLGVLSGFSVGGAILPLGFGLLFAAVISNLRRPGRIAAGAAAAAALGALAFVGTPMLEGLSWIGAPALPVERTVPQPGDVNVPLTAHITVSTKALPLNDGTTQSLRVRYVDRGFAWLRPAVPGGDGGRSTMDASGNVGGTTFTFAPTPAFEACRTVGVTAVAGGYRPYRFEFRTACPYP